MKTKAIHKRQRFEDPPCLTCWPSAIAYSFRKAENGRWRVFARCTKCGKDIKSFRPCRVPARIKLKINPSGGRFEMKYQQQPSEFEIQAYLYCELRRLGYDARGEVTTKDGDCRFDIVIFSGRRPVRIIEVKSCRKKYRSRQLDQYRIYGIKVISVCGMEQAIELVRKAASSGPRAGLPLLVGL